VRVPVRRPIAAFPFALSDLGDVTDWDGATDVIARDLIEHLKHQVILTEYNASGHVWFEYFPKNGSFAVSFTFEHNPKARSWPWIRGSFVHTPERGKAIFITLESNKKTLTVQDLESIKLDLAKDVRHEVQHWIQNEEGRLPDPKKVAKKLKFTPEGRVDYSDPDNVIRYLTLPHEVEAAVEAHIYDAKNRGITLEQSLTNKYADLVHALRFWKVGESEIARVVDAVKPVWSARSKILLKNRYFDGILKDIARHYATNVVPVLRGENKQPMPGRHSETLDTPAEIMNELNGLVNDLSKLKAEATKSGLAYKTRVYAELADFENSLLRQSDSVLAQMERTEPLREFVPRTSLEKLRELHDNTFSKVFTDSMSVLKDAFFLETAGRMLVGSTRAHIHWDGADLKNPDEPFRKQIKGPESVFEFVFPKMSSHALEVWGNRIRYGLQFGRRAPGERPAFSGGRKPSPMSRWGHVPADAYLFGKRRPGGKPHGGMRGLGFTGLDDEPSFWPEEAAVDEIVRLAAKAIENRPVIASDLIELTDMLAQILGDPAVSEDEKQAITSDSLALLRQAAGETDVPKLLLGLGILSLIPLAWFFAKKKD
jgi:hypothetical protein